MRDFPFKASNLKYTSKKHKSVLFAFFTSVILLDACSIIFAIKDKKDDYYDFYSSKKIFYVQALRSLDDGDIIESNEFLKIGVYLYYTKGEFDYFEMNRLYYSNGTVSPLYYLICDKKYLNMCFKVIDSHSGTSIINETYPTKINKYGTYTLSFEKGWSYNYSKSKWSSPSINANQFADLFIQQHDFELKDDFCKGIYSYPNLNISFSSIVNKTADLKSVSRKNTYLSGENAYEQWLSLKKEFFDEGVEHV